MILYTRAMTAGDSFTPTRDMNIFYLAYQVSTDTGDYATLTGSAKSPEDGSDSEEIIVPGGGGDAFVDVPGKPITGMTISCGQGTVYLRIGY